MWRDPLEWATPSFCSFLSFKRFFAGLISLGAWHRAETLFCKRTDAQVLPLIIALPLDARHK